MPFEDFQSPYTLIPSTKWASRYVAFHDDRLRPFTVFPVEESIALDKELPLPPNLLETLSDINDEFGYRFDLAQKYDPKISTDMMLAGMTSDYLFNKKNPFDISPSLRLQSVFDMANKLSKSSHYAGPKASPSKVFSLYQDYLAGKVNPFGVFGSNVLNQLANWKARQRYFELLTEAVQEVNQSNKPICSRRLSDLEKGVVLHDMYDVLHRNGEDASWISDIADYPFDIRVYRIADGYGPQNNVRGGVNFDLERPMINMNLGKIVDDGPEILSYSKMLRTRFVHELRHIWQSKNRRWLPKNGKKNILTEIDAHQMQYLMERLLGMSPSKQRKIFEAPEQRIKDLGHFLLRKGYRNYGYEYFGDEE